MKKYQFIYLGLFAIIAFSASATLAQIPRLDPGALGRNKNIASPVDRFFDVQKQGGIRSASFEVWITVDGVVHCKTSATLKDAAIKFTFPTNSSTGTGGTTTSSGGDYSRKLEVKAPGADGYIFPTLASDKYREKHSITLYVTTTTGVKAEVTLTNKKVPASISN